MVIAFLVLEPNNKIQYNVEVCVMDPIVMIGLVTLSRDEKMEIIPNLLSRIRELMDDEKLELRELAKIGSDLWWLQGPYTFYAMDGRSSPFEDIHSLWAEIKKIDGIKNAGECNNKSMIENLRGIEEITELELLSLHGVKAMNRVPELLVQVNQTLDEKRRILESEEKIKLVKSLLKVRDYFTLRRTSEQSKWGSEIRENILKTINEIDEIINKLIEE